MNSIWRKLQCLIKGHLWEQKRNKHWHQQVCICCGKHGPTLFIPVIAETPSPTPRAGGINWQDMDSAPRDRDILVLTSDFGVVQARWDTSAVNFYKSQEGWDSYDPENAQGDWCSDWQIGNDGDRRLYCGATPQMWADIGDLPSMPEGDADAD